MEIIQPPGVVLAVLPPLSNGLLADYLSSARNLPLALYFVDDFMEPDIRLVRKAKAVFAATEQIRQRLVSHYRLKEEQVTLVRVGYPELVNVDSMSSPQVDGTKLRIVYAGSINSNTGATIIPKAVRGLRKQLRDEVDGLEIDVFAPMNGPFAFYMRHFLSDRSVRYRGYVPFDNLMKELISYDLALVTVTGNISFASKVYHYINAELPLLVVSGDVELRRFVEQHGIGRHSALNDSESLAKNIRFFMENRDSLGYLKDRIRKIKPFYDLKSQAIEMSQVLERNFQGIE